MITVQIDELISNAKATMSDDEMLILFNDDGSNIREAYGKLWGLVVMMALRDDATSVHYHPWRKDGALAYIVNNTRYEMVPPPAQFASVCIDVARCLFTQPQGFFSRLWQPAGNVASSTVRMEYPGWVSLWDAVVWSSGERAGVELFLITQYV